MAGRHDPKKTHEDIRLGSCFFCLRKGETKSDKTLTTGEVNLIILNFFPSFETFKDFLPLGCCGACRANLSYRFGKNPNMKRYKTFPCESDDQYYQKVVEKLQKLPRGNSQNTECKCFICTSAHEVLKSVKLKPGVPKPEFSNQRSRDNRTLEQSRLDEATELMSKLTPKLKDALVYARVKEKQEENKSSDDTLTFSSAVGGTPVTVAPNLGARKKLNYEHPKTPKTPVSKKNISKYCQCY